MTGWSPIPELPIHAAVSADERVFAAALGLSIASGLVFGLLPARLVWRTSAAQVIKGSAGERGMLRRFSVRDVLLVCRLRCARCW